MNDVEIEESVSQLAESAFDAEEFPFVFLKAVGNPSSISHSNRAKLRVPTTSEIDLKAAVSPNRRTSGQRRGHGLAGPERKPVDPVLFLGTNA